MAKLGSPSSGELPNPEAKANALGRADDIFPHLTKYMILGALCIPLACAALLLVFVV